MNLKKKVSAFLASVMCFSAVSAAAPAAMAKEYDTVSVQVSELKAGDAAYEQLKSEVGVSYSSALAKQVKKLNTSKAKKTVKFSKSLTAKLDKKFTKALADGKGVCMAMRDSSDIIEMDMKGDNFRLRSYNKESGLMSMFFDADLNITICMEMQGQKMKLALSGEDMMSMMSALGGDEALGGMSDISSLTKDGAAALGVNTNYDAATPVAVFTFTYKEKTYTYERFTADDVTAGFLYNEKGTPVMISAKIDGQDVIMGLKVKYSVSDSAFKVPDGYMDISSMFGDIDLSSLT